MKSGGLFITFEGIDGSGKSTLVQKVARYLGIKALPHISTREPGGSTIGMPIRSILQESTVLLEPRAEYLLFAADRAQHVATIIKPALANNLIVLCDRFTDSSLVYQGYGRGLNIDMIKKINQWATNHLEPDITFYLEISLKVACERIAQRASTLTNFEKENAEFFTRLIHGYEEIRKHTQRVITLDASQSPETVFEATCAHIARILTTSGQQ